MVSARACAYQLLPYTLQVLIYMITVQADSCLYSEQIDTHLLVWGVRKGGGGGGNLGPEAQKLHVIVRDFNRLLAK